MKATSIEAKQISLTFTDEHKSAILSALEGADLTSPEIHLKTGISYIAISRRMSELERANKVRVVSTNRVFNVETMRYGTYSVYSKVK